VLNVDGMNICARKKLAIILDGTPLPKVGVSTWVIPLDHLIIVLPET
jgi:hypothetical protein